MIIKSQFPSTVIMQFKNYNSIMVPFAIQRQNLQDLMNLDAFGNCFLNYCRKHQLKLCYENGCGALLLSVVSLRYNVFIFF